MIGSHISKNMIKAVEKVIVVDEARIHLTLIIMHRTFLLVLKRDQGNHTPIFGQSLALEGLSMALGDFSSSIFNSGDSLSSSSLATRLSKSCNKNKPVYVANNCGIPGESITDLYMKAFQFVRANYKPVYE